MNPTALVVDDEPYARAHLRLMLETIGVEVLGEADSVARALQLVEDLRPEVVFLDVEMPGLTGVQMARAIAQMENAPMIVFVTGYSEYAVDAFECGAVDYLLKPLSPERLSVALQRVQSRRAEALAKPQAGPAQPRPAGPLASPLMRLPVRIDYAVRLLRIEEIVAASARDKRVFVQTADGAESRTYYTLTQLEEMLPPERFARIHDSFLVNLECIEEIVYLGSHSYEVKLRSGAMLPVGRRRFADLKRRLGLSDA